MIFLQNFFVPPVDRLARQSWLLEQVNDGATKVVVSLGVVVATVVADAVAIDVTDDEAVVDEKEDEVAAVDSVSGNMLVLP